MADGIPTPPSTASKTFTPRYTGPSPAAMTTEQLALRSHIASTRPRTGLSGPFGPWLSTPAIAEPAQSLGRAVRYGTSLTAAESELVILLTAAKTRSWTAFDLHRPEALRAGLEARILDAIPRDGAFWVERVAEVLLPLLGERLRTIARFTAEVLDRYQVSDGTYEEARRVLGDESVLVEIISIAGYYTYVAYTVNVFKIPST